MQALANPDDRATELFFQLASLDRRRILSEFETENLSLTETATRLDITATEALRQLHRMTEAGLLDRMPDGKYHLTTYARLVLETSSSLDFISRFREYFKEHDASGLPIEYRNRLGELSRTKLTTNTVETFNKVTEMIKSAKEKIDATVEVGFEIHLNMMRQRLGEGVKVRWLMQESFLPSAKTLLRSDKQSPEIRSVPRVSGHIYLTDKAAAVTLRRNNGSMGYSAFMGEDPSFLRWTNDLFEQEWEKASRW